MAGMMPGIDELHVQAKFFTKLKKYVLQESQFSLPSSSGCNELNDLLKGLLFSEEDDVADVEFDFLIEGDFLQSTIQEYISKTNLSTEGVIDIEYILKEDSPRLIQSLLHDDWISSIDFSNDLIITGSYDNTLAIWNTTGKCLSSIEGHTMAVKNVAWNNLNNSWGSFITASQDQTVQIWQFDPADNSSTCAHVCKGHTRSVDCLTIHPSGSKFASGSWDKMIKIWDAGVALDAGDEGESELKKLRKDGKSNMQNIRTPLMTLSGHKEPVSCLVWHDDNELISGSWDHCIRFWDIETSMNKRTLTGNKVILDISYSSFSHLVASGSADKYIRLWDTRVSGEGTIVKNMLSSHSGWISSIDWSPNNENHLVSGSYDCSVKLWDIRCTSEPIHELGKHNDKVMCVSWKHSKFVASGGADCNLHLYEISSKLPVNQEE